MLGEAVRAALAAGFFGLSSLACAAIESQAIGWVEQLPSEVRRVFTCGQWSDRSATGFHRVVLVDVNHGAGTEVYVQRLQVTIESFNPALHVAQTIAIRELNDDHAQFQVLSARCAGTSANAVVDLVASFEHDPGDVKHRIRIRLPAVGRYSISGFPYRRARGR